MPSGIVASRPSTATQASVATPRAVRLTPGKATSPRISVMTRPTSVVAELKVIFPMT